MMSELERALRELESATAAIATVPIEHFAEGNAALDRRYWAIADLSRLAGAPLSLAEEDREDAVRRLRLAFEAGGTAAQRFSSARSAAVAEWNQWSRIYRALGAEESPRSTRVDFSG